VLSTNLSRGTLRDPPSERTRNTTMRKTKIGLDQSLKAVNRLEKEGRVTELKKKPFKPPLAQPIVSEGECGSAASQEKADSGHSREVRLFGRGRKSGQTNIGG